MVIVIIAGTLIALLPNMKPAKVTVRESELPGRGKLHGGEW